MADKEKRDLKMQHEQRLENKAGSAESEQGAILPPEAQGQIGKQLRHVYSEMLSEPMPDKFAELLARLSKSEREQ